MVDKSTLDTLERLCVCLDQVRRQEPKLTLTGLLAVLLIARETNARDLSRLPIASKVGVALGMSSSVAGRLLDSLSTGRVRDGKAEDGLGLLATDSQILGRRSKGYVLTARGKSLVSQIIFDLSDENPDWFRPLDDDALFQVLVRDFAKSK